MQGKERHGQGVPTLATRVAPISPSPPGQDVARRSVRCRSSRKLNKFALFGWWHGLPAPPQSRLPSSRCLPQLAPRIRV